MALNAIIYNLQGEKQGEKELDPRIFDVPVSKGLVHQVIESFRANARGALAHTKGRGEVRGGGKKPWRQKGTGRARHGSIRSPIWKGGGVAHGPTKQKIFFRKINKGMKEKALCMALSDKARHNHIFLLDAWPSNAIKTKVLASSLSCLPCYGKKKTIMPTLFGYSLKEQGVLRAGRNISALSLSPVGNINCLEVLKNNYLLMTVASLEDLNKRLAPA
jgi:large subunit ribosomal protein L4